MKIAIVDDIQADRVWLSGKLMEYCQQRGIDFELLEYKNGEEFVATLKNIYYDIVFMDIYMEGMSGLEAAGELRRVNMDCRLVLVTSSEEHFRQGYEYNTCYYLLKSQRKETFLKAMAHCQMRLSYDVPLLEIKQNGKHVWLDTGKIIYIDVEGHTTKIHLYGKVLSQHKESFTSCTKPLEADRRFLLCIQGILVNMDWISAFEKDTLLLKTGERLPVAVRSRKTLLNTYHSYVFDSMMRGPA